MNVVGDKIVSLITPLISDHLNQFHIQETHHQMNLLFSSSYE
jgi:hypothetical protein